MIRDNPGCLPSGGTLRRIRWSLQPRSRDHLGRLRDPRQPLDDALAPPWAYADPRPFTRPSPTTACPFARGTCRRCRRQPLRARSPFTLAATLFGALRVSVFETRHRLPTSATAYDARALRPRLSFPRRDGDRDPLPFLTRHARPSRPFTERSGDTRRAARPSEEERASVPVPPVCTGLPDRDDCPLA